MSGVAATPRVGILGAGRTRNGLGPFLASAFERAGCHLAAVAGHTPASAARTAAALGDRLGHAVAATGSARELAASGLVDLLVVAAPVEAHLEGLEAALAARLPCLCEKPLVLPEQTGRGLELAAAFAEAGLLLMENCQWPFVLPAYFALHPPRAGEPPRELELGLGPRGRGREMVRDTLSHALSLAQGLLGSGAEAELGDVRQEDPGPRAERNRVHFAVRARGGQRLSVTLHLARCPEQPRPAWLAVDGRRADRRIGADYAWSLVAEDGREQSLTDPLHALVYRCAALLSSPCLDDTRSLAESVRRRLRWYRQVLAALHG